MAGRSGSVAVRFRLIGERSDVMRFGAASNTGGWFTSRTPTETVCESEPPLPSETVRLKRCRPFWSSAGVQEKAPDDGLIEAPSGRPAAEKVRVSGGSSGSVTGTTKSSGRSSNVSMSQTVPSTGGEFVSLTVISTTCESVPPAPSLTVTLTKCGPS